jgi:rod shape-determining protein MreC
MAWGPPRSRTPGSRRDARARLAGLALGVVAVLAGLVFLALGAGREGRGPGLANDIVATTWTLLRPPVELLQDVGEAIRDRLDAPERIARLEAENAALRERLDAARAAEEESRRLRRLLRVSAPTRTRIAVAHVAGGAAGSLVDTAVISAGRTLGVAVGQPVLTDAGLLGRVTSVGARSARVLLVSDAASRVPVRIERTGTPAILAGMGSGRAALTYVEGSETSGGVRAGDRLVTSGEGGLFPPGVPVAQVLPSAPGQALARPLARPSLTGFAIVEAAWLPAPPATQVADASAVPDMREDVAPQP